MSTTKRIVIAVIIIAVIAGGILLVDSLRRGGCLYRHVRAGSEGFSGGCVRIYSGERVAGRFCPSDADALKKISFRDPQEHKLQEGWLLRDAILLRLDGRGIAPGSRVTVSSSSRGKKAELSWKDVADESNRVILAVSKQGSLKLVSPMKGFDTRELWVQEVDAIRVTLR